MDTEVTLGAIDAGSNAIRVVIARSVGGQLTVVEAERVPVRLGHHTFTHGELDTKTIEAAVVAFARFRKLFDQHGVTRYRAVATSALRNAANREDLIDRLYRELKIELEVIDGEEEGRLVRRAVLHAMKGRTEPALIVDLGGGSLEVTERQRDKWVTWSMKIGTVRLLETFGLGGRISEDEARLVRRYIATSLVSTLPDPPADKAERHTSALACGGNAEALASLYGQSEKGEKGEKGESPLPTLKISAIEDALPALLEADVPERMSKLGVRQDRAEVLPVAALVFAELGKRLGLKKLAMPGVGIREGLLVDLAEATGAGRPSSQEPAVISAARVFADRMGHNTAHGEQVRMVARALFDQLEELHDLPEELRPLLEVAALLHDIGEVVHRRAHHKHSEYMILNGRIPGLETQEREIVAAVVRGHRKSAPDPRKHAIYASLPEARQDQVRKLCALLRVADALDADHRQRIMGVTAEIKTKKVVLQLESAANGTPAVHADLTKGLSFEEVFGRKLVVEIREVPAAPQSSRRRRE